MNTTRTQEGLVTAAVVISLLILTASFVAGFGQKIAGEQWVSPWLLLGVFTVSIILFVGAVWYYKKISKR